MNRQGTLQAVELPDIITLNQLFYLVATPLTGFEHNIIEEKIMKLVKNFALTVLLALVLAVSAPAGEVPMPGVASPTPTPTPQGISKSDQTKSDYYGDPNAPVVTAETSDYLFFEALAALLSMY